MAVDSSPLTTRCACRRLGVTHSSCMGATVASHWRITDARKRRADVVAEADWVLDLGPEGGAGGGQIVAAGAPEQVAKIRSRSHTAKALRPFLRSRRKSG